MRLPNIRPFTLKRVPIVSRYYGDSSNVFLVVLTYITADIKANIDLQKNKSSFFDISITV